MENKNVKVLQGKVADYTGFAYVLLAISVFIYIGVIIPEERAPFELTVMMCSTLLFLASSFEFFRLVLKYKKQLHELED